MLLLVLQFNLLLLMSNVAEIISADGEVISINDFSSQEELDFKLLKMIDFEIIKSFFIKKTLVDLVRAKHNLTHGHNGLTAVEASRLVKWEDVQTYLNELEQKKVVKKKKGVNLDMYFLIKKLK